MEDIPKWKVEHPTWHFDHQAAGVKGMATNQKRYGMNFPEQIGRKGGKVSSRRKREAAKLQEADNA